MTKTPSPLSQKQARSIEHALAFLVGEKASRLITSIEDYRDAQLSRELKLSNNRIALITDRGLEEFERVIDVMVDAKIYEGLADYSEIWAASWKTLEELLSSRGKVKSAQEWLGLISAKIDPQIHLRRIVVPFIGVEFKGIDDLALGSFRLLRPSISFLDHQGVDHARADVPKIIAGYQDQALWLYGSVRGTRRVVERKIQNLSDLIAGLLAVLFAVLAKSGATRVFISSAMSGHGFSRRPDWHSWEETASIFTNHGNHRWVPPFVIDKDRREEFAQVSEISTAMRIFETETRTPLEEAVARGFRWFADAHRDPTLVMQFVKYWSCIETFFSREREKITKSVSVGVASVLVFGGYGFAQQDEYSQLKKRVEKLYDLRSDAVHEAKRDHVTEQDVIELSGFAARLLYNALSFVERGYQRPEEIKQHCMRLDEQHKRGHSADNPG